MPPAWQLFSDAGNGSPANGVPFVSQGFAVFGIRMPNNEQV